MTAIRTDTAEAGWPWALPPVTRVYLVPRARLRRRKNKFLASAFVADVTHGTRRAMAILGAVGALYVAVAVVRGIQFVALTIRSHPVLFDLIAAFALGAVFTAVAFAVWLRSDDKAVEK